jgi:hypothetical protein
MVTSCHWISRIVHPIVVLVGQLRTNSVNSLFDLGQTCWLIFCSGNILINFHQQNISYNSLVNLWANSTIFPWQWLNEQFTNQTVQLSLYTTALWVGYKLNTACKIKNVSTNWEAIVLTYFSDLLLTKSEKIVYELGCIIQIYVD